MLASRGTYDPNFEADPLPVPDWSALAAELRYSDQSHLVNEFRDFAGITPGAYVAAYRGLENYLPIGADFRFFQYGLPSPSHTPPRTGDFHMPAVNWLAVIAAAVSMFVIGGLWYSALFQKQWMAANGFTDEDMKRGSPAVIFGVAFVLSLLMAANLAFFVSGRAGPRRGDRLFGRGGAWLGGVRALGGRALRAAAADVPPHQRRLPHGGLRRDGADPGTLALGLSRLERRTRERRKALDAADQFVDGAAGLVDRRVRIGIGAGVGIGDGDAAPAFAGGLDRQRACGQ